MKHELFARSIVTGMTLHAAYSAAGYRAKNNNAAHASGGRLLRNATVAARIEELKAELLPQLQEAMRLDAEFITSRLMAISQGKVPDGDEPFDALHPGVRIAALSKLGEVLGIFKAPAVMDDEQAARALAKQADMSLEDARAAIAEAARFDREHS